MQPGKIINQVVNGQEITVTYRGKALAKIVPIKRSIQNAEKEESIFGLWKDRDAVGGVEEHVRNLRKGRRF